MRGDSENVTRKIKKKKQKGMSILMSRLTGSVENEEVLRKLQSFEDTYVKFAEDSLEKESVPTRHIDAVRDVPEKMIHSLKDSGFYMGGKWQNGKGFYIGKGIEDDGNVLVVGTNGSGKSRTIAKSTIETWSEPFVALDIKGELSQHYESLLREGRVKRKYIIFDPLFGEVSYEPFLLLKRDEINLEQHVREIVYAIIPMPPNDLDSYWITMARDLLTAVLIYGHSIGLDFIETTIMAAYKSVPKLCRMIIKSDNSLAKAFITKIIGLKSEQQASIGTDMMQHLMVFATDSCIQNALSNDQNKKTFSWEDISVADDVPNVFLRLSQDRLEQWNGVIRLMITQLVRTLERRPDKHSQQGCKTSPILILLDEFPLLGNMDVIKSALTTLRSKKVTFCLMLQSVAQLDAAYGKDDRKTIVDNCQYKILLNITEPDSQEYFSRLIGSGLVERRSFSQSYNPSTGCITYGQQIQATREPWIFPHEFATNSDIVLHTPYGWFRTCKCPISRMYDANNTHTQTLRFNIESVDISSIVRRLYDC